jgi:hypothetical protein
VAYSGSTPIPIGSRAANDANDLLIEPGAARTPTAATPSSLYGIDLAPLVDLARRRQPLPSRPMDRRLRLPVPASSRPPGQWRVLHSPPDRAAATAWTDAQPAGSADVPPELEINGTFYVAGMTVPW